MQPTFDSATLRCSHLTTRKTLYVEISRARDLAEFVTDDRVALKEQLEAVTGERFAALEAVEPERAKGQEGGAEAGRDMVKGRETPERAREPEPEKALESQSVNREFTL